MSKTAYSINYQFVEENEVVRQIDKRKEFESYVGVIKWLELFNPSDFKYVEMYNKFGETVAAGYCEIMLVGVCKR